MKKISFNIVLFFVCSLLLCMSCSNTSEQSKREIFEPGNISSTLVEHSPTFSDDETEMYFTRSTGKWGQGGGKTSIYFSSLKNGKWSTPKLASFSGNYNDSAPHLCDHGRTLYFTSSRPSDDVVHVSKDIWKVEKDTSGVWGIPIRLNDSVNSERSEYSPRTDKHGNLYFASNRSGGYGQGDVYFAKKTENGFSNPVNIGSRVNSEYGEWNLEINKEGNTLIFESSGRDENLSPYGDLYISFKNDEGWSIPQNIQELNTTGSDLYATFAKDETLLYYASSDSLKSVRTNIYAIKFADILKKYKANTISQK